MEGIPPSSMSLEGTSIIDEPELLEDISCMGISLAPNVISTADIDIPTPITVYTAAIRKTASIAPVTIRRSLASNCSIPVRSFITTLSVMEYQSGLVSNYSCIVPMKLCNVAMCIVCVCKLHLSSMSFCSATSHFSNREFNTLR